MRQFCHIIFLILLAVVYVSCSGDEGICIGSAGKTVQEERPALPMHKIEVYDNINLFLIQDSLVHNITVEAGENLISGITTEIDSGRLELRNLNSCDWMRSFEVPVNVYVRFSRLDSVRFQAAGNVTCMNAWTGDSLYFEVVEGAGQISLDIAAFRSKFNIRYGTTRIDLKGFSQVTFISHQGYGPFHAENMGSKFTYIYSFSPNDVFVNATEEISAEIGNIGNVYYRGNPASVSVITHSGGRLIEF